MSFLQTKLHSWGRYVSAGDKVFIQLCSTWLVVAVKYDYSKVVQIPKIPKI